MTPTSRQLLLLAAIIAAAGAAAWVLSSWISSWIPLVLAGGLLIGLAAGAFLDRARFVHARGLARDVTGARADEQEHQRAQERYRTIVETANEGVWLMDDQGRTLYVNERLAAMLGHAPGEIIGRSIQEFCFPEDVETARDRIAHNLQGFPTQFDLRLRRRDGRGVPVLACTNAVRDADRRIIGALGLFTDLTSRKRTEEALRLSESRYRALAENVPALVWTAAPDGACDYFNQRWCDETGLSLENSLGWGWRKAVCRDDLAPALEQWSHALASGSAIQNQLRLIRPDGSLRWHLVRATPVHDAQGRISAWFGTCTDIHDQKLAETCLAELNAALSRSNRDLEDFAHIAAHDLREPLRGMRLSASFLGEDAGDKLDADSKRHLASIDRLGRRMDQLIQSLLHYSIVGQADLAYTPVDLNALVGGVVDSLGPLLRERGIQIRIPEALPTIRCDPVRVGEVFRNLVSNAIKYNTRDGDRWIHIGARPPENGHPLPVLFVSDNGIGIAPEHQQAVFRIFKRLHARDEFGGGTGSGLAIVKRIVERHGGRIWIDSALDAGSTFLFTLGQSEPAPRPAATPAREPAAMAPRG